MNNAMIDNRDRITRAIATMQSDKALLEAELKVIQARHADPEYRKTSNDGRRCIDRVDQIRADTIRQSLKTING